MPTNADGLSVSDWNISGDCVFFSESDNEYALVLRLSAIEAAHMIEEDQVDIYTATNEYTQTVIDPRGLINALAGTLRKAE